MNNVLLDSDLEDVGKTFALPTKFLERSMARQAKLKQQAEERRLKQEQEALMLAPDVKVTTPSKSANMIPKSSSPKTTPASTKPATTLRTPGQTTRPTPVSSSAPPRRPSKTPVVPVSPPKRPSKTPATKHASPKPLTSYNTAPRRSRSPTKSTERKPVPMPQLRLKLVPSLSTSSLPPTPTRSSATSTPTSTVSAASSEATFKSQKAPQRRNRSSSLSDKESLPIRRVTFEPPHTPISPSPKRTDLRTASPAAGRKATVLAGMNRPSSPALMQQLALIAEQKDTMRPTQVLGNGLSNTPPSSSQSNLFSYQSSEVDGVSSLVRGNDQVGDDLDVIDKYILLKQDMEAEAERRIRQDNAAAEPRPLPRPPRRANSVPIFRQAPTSGEQLGIIQEEDRPRPVKLSPRATPATILQPTPQRRPDTLQPWQGTRGPTPTSSTSPLPRPSSRSSRHMTPTSGFDPPTPPQNGLPLSHFLAPTLPTYHRFIFSQTNGISKKEQELIRRFQAAEQSGAFGDTLEYAAELEELLRKKIGMLVGLYGVVKEVMGQGQGTPQQWQAQQQWQTQEQEQGDWQYEQEEWREGEGQA